MEGVAGASAFCGEGIAAISVKDTEGESAGEGIWCLAWTELEIGKPLREWVLCISELMGVRGIEKLWDLVGVCSLLHKGKSNELFMGVVSGVRGIPEREVSRGR